MHKILSLAAVIVLGGSVGCVSEHSSKGVALGPDAGSQAATSAARLRGDLATLSGSRSPHDVDALARAAAHIRETWTALGYTVVEHPYDCGDGQVKNLEVVLPGDDPSASEIVVGAHYDSVAVPGGTPGADDNASGVALLLELSRSLREQPHARTIRLVAFTCEEPPYFQTDTMGSLVYARMLKAKGVKVAAMVSLESVGFYSSDQGSQGYPEELADSYPTQGNFALVVGDVASAPLVKRFAAALSAKTTLPVEQSAFPSELEGVGWSDHWSFWQTGVPAVMLTDTAPFRNPHYHRSTDTLDTLEVQALAALAEGLPSAILELATN